MTILAHFGGSPTAFLFQLFGLFMIATAGAKLTTVVYDEGTFLRQKLFLVLGVVDLLLAFTVFNYKALGTDVTGGLCSCTRSRSRVPPRRADPGAQG